MRLVPDSAGYRSQAEADRGQPGRAQSIITERGFSVRRTIFNAFDLVPVDLCTTAPGGRNLGPTDRGSRKVEYRNLNHYRRRRYCEGSQVLTGVTGHPP